MTALPELSDVGLPRPAAPVAGVPVVLPRSGEGMDAQAPADLSQRPGLRLLETLLQGPGRRERLTSVTQVPAAPGRTRPWPSWVHPDLRAALVARGVAQPWGHQVAAAQAAWDGEHVVLSTGTASGKSLAYLLPALSRSLDAQAAGQRSTTLYLSPTKALAGDQLRTVTGLELNGVRASLYDGDTPSEQRAWVRDWANVVLTNPDMLHVGVLPDHARWVRFLRSLSYVVVDECHAYRGVFGSHVSAVLRRLRRVCARYGAHPTFVLASATVSDPASSARRLTGLEFTEVTEDCSPRGGTVFALWEPPVTEGSGENGAPVRRSATAEAADLLTDLVLDDARTLAFVRSRKAAETVALQCARSLEEAGAGELAGSVAAYRAGYLPEDRRAIERSLKSGALRAVASTNALELGVDICGMDAVVLAGWPGTSASMWQQAGRAGRDGRESLAVLIARDDPLDTFLVRHPDYVVGRPPEATVLDPENPYVLAPHLCAAAAELPLTPEDSAWFGPTMPGLLDALTAGGALRRRPSGWFWTRHERASSLVGLRGTGGAPVRIVERSTGRVLGTVDAAASHSQVHAGAVHVHMGQTFVVHELDLDDGVAVVSAADPDWTTTAREVADLRVLAEETSTPWGDARLSLGTVEVTSQVVAFLRRRVQTGEVLGEHPLDLPPRMLTTKAVWWTVTPEQLVAARLEPADVPGAAHAAEHASIGLLPLFATCDRWDIGGLSTALHPDTGAMTVFVHDGHPGGAGFAERGYSRAAQWLRATRTAIAECPCTTGCPSCVQSPKCGNGNDPLDKAGAVRLLDVVLAGAPV
ncbi:DEAD/DEAH box helicase domain-containing protein [Motilibacter peucedani]|uniref:DEAD/DEAH box helicase domain-containing protein n=2 Tax=Motilibacter peucedani TaxID=598650 RepID=A0A420XPZ6_9ACTN|nr:DEAD/DEAH box helicase [Motilibacter peucedani]RKS75353.1 DEAD/DEAH box helicase domain-containing protein [Motilibacter peucedani]